MKLQQQVPEAFEKLSSSLWLRRRFSSSFLAFFTMVTDSISGLIFSLFILKSVYNFTRVAENALKENLITGLCK